jgi:hypothetical protein
MVGTIEATEEYADRFLVRLVDGRVWERPHDQFRVPYRLGSSPLLFVAGRDTQGTYILLIGSLPGLPDDCRYPIGHGGREWGDAIEAEGFLWQKSPSFPASAIPIGIAYPKSVQFCLDEQARVESSTSLQPPGSDGPAGSARTD